jgi:acyl phosphate:glycerol-3-phosphate acyltransferase
MSAVITVIILLLAYLLGSIPTSVWIGKFFYGIDIRDHGSGNAGATNTFRVLGITPGLFVFLFDTLKGWMAAHLVIFSNLNAGTNNYFTLEIFLGIAAILGHIYPFFANYRGGKGIATSLGVVIALHPLCALFLFIFFLIFLIITRFVSLSSIICSILFPALLIFYFRITSYSLIIFSIVIMIVVIITHRKNISRLIAGEEKKVKFFNVNKKTIKS